MDAREAVREAAAATNLNGRAWAICVDHTGELVTKAKNKVRLIDTVLEVCQPTKRGR